VRECESERQYEVRSKKYGTAGLSEALPSRYSLPTEEAPGRPHGRILPYHRIQGNVHVRLRFQGRVLDWVIAPLLRPRNRRPGAP
jgi:hypothetical protein